MPGDLAKGESPRVRSQEDVPSSATVADRAAVRKSLGYKFFHHSLLILQSSIIGLTGLQSGVTICHFVVFFNTFFREAFKKKVLNVNFFQKGGRGSTPKFTF